MFDFLFLTTNIGPLIIFMGSFGITLIQVEHYRR